MERMRGESNRQDTSQCNRVQQAHARHKARLYMLLYANPSNSADIGFNYEICVKQHHTFSPQLPPQPAAAAAAA
jgi:hypothetical protein